MSSEKNLDKKYIKIYARFFRKVGTAILIFAYIVSVLALTVYGTINFSSKKYVGYYETMADKYSYYDRVTENLKNELNALELPDGITADGIYSALDIDGYKIYAGKYLMYICKKVFYDPKTLFEAEYTTDSLDLYLQGSKNSELLKAEIISCISNSARFLPDEKYNLAFNTISDIIEKRTAGKFILSDIYGIIEGSAFRFFDALFIAAILMFLIYKLNAVHRKRSFYLMGIAAFLGSVAALIPAAALHGALMKFAIVTEKSFSRDLIAIAHARTANTLLIIAVIIFIISFAGFIISLAIYAPHHAKTRRRHHRKDLKR